MTDEEIKKFRDGIFSLRTNFGELAQLMLQKDMGFFPSNDKSYDLKNKDEKKIEVKFSRAYKKGIQLTEKNAIDLCSNFSTMVYDSTDAENKLSDYDCNIQQIKPECFDYLYYGVFFRDKIEIFCAERSIFPESIEAFKKDKESTRKKLPGYALQHKGGSECQFHITKTTHKHHHEKYYLKDITYEDLYDLLKSEE